MCIFSFHYISFAFQKEENFFYFILWFYLFVWFGLVGVSLVWFHLMLSFQTHNKYNFFFFIFLFFLVHFESERFILDLLMRILRSLHRPSYINRVCVQMHKSEWMNECWFRNICFLLFLYFILFFFLNSYMGLSWRHRWQNTCFFSPLLIRFVIYNSTAPTNSFLWLPVGFCFLLTDWDIVFCCVVLYCF